MTPTGNRFMWFDAIVVALITCGVVIWGERFGGRAVIEAQLDGNRAAVYQTLAGMTSAMLGFVMAAVTILLPYVRDDRLSFLQENDAGHETQRVLWKTFKAALLWLGATTVVAMVGLVLDRDSSGGRFTCPPMPYVMTAFALASAGIVARCVWILLGIIDVVTTDRTRKPGESRFRNTG